MKSKKEVNSSLLLISLIALSLLVLGADGCTMPGGRTGTSGKGIDFSLEGGVGNIVSGKTIQVGDEFYVKLNVLNYNEESKSVMICVRDNIAESFGGIHGEEGDCKTQTLTSAEVTQQSTGIKTTKTLQPSSNTFYFGPYTYIDIPLDTPAKLFVSARYIEQPKITANVQVPIPETETLSLTQTPAVISAAITKTIHPKQNAYSADFSIKFSKQQNVKIFSSDFRTENISLFSITMPPLDVECVNAKGYFEIKNEKLISCSALAYLSTQEQVIYPLIIQLNYGVEDLSEFNFVIKTLPS